MTPELSLLSYFGFVFFSLLCFAVLFRRLLILMPDVEIWLALSGRVCAEFKRRSPLRMFLRGDVVICE